MTIHTNANTLLYINGRWRSGHSPSLPVVDPATEARIGTFATAGVGDLDDAVASKGCPYGNGRALSNGTRR